MSPQLQANQISHHGMAGNGRHLLGLANALQNARYLAHLAAGLRNAVESPLSRAQRIAAEVRARTPSMQVKRLTRL